jgi:septal ring factor EnvC (AmiA/AmiB activator)
MEDDIVSSVPDQFSIDRIEAALRQKDDRISCLETMIREKDLLLSRFEHELGEKEKELSLCNDVLSEEKAKMANLEDELRLRVLRLEKLKRALVQYKSGTEYAGNGG